MQAIEMHGFGTADVLNLTQRSVPLPNENQMRLRVCAAGVNGADIVQKRELYPPPSEASDLLGLEVFGEVIICTNKATRWHIGDWLCALTNCGGYSHYVTVAADYCLPIAKIYHYVTRRNYAKCISWYGVIYFINKNCRGQYYFNTWWGQWYWILCYYSILSYF